MSLWRTCGTYVTVWYADKHLRFSVERINLGVGVRSSWVELNVGMAITSTSSHTRSAGQPRVPRNTFQKSLKLFNKFITTIRQVEENVPEMRRFSCCSAIENVWLIRVSSFWKKLVFFRKLVALVSFFHRFWDHRTKRLSNAISKIFPSEKFDISDLENSILRLKVYFALFITTSKNRQIRAHTEKKKKTHISGRPLVPAENLGASRSRFFEVFQVLTVSGWKRLHFQCTIFLNKLSLTWIVVTF